MLEVPLSGKPMPGSQAEVTMLLPDGDGAQPGAVPTNTAGTARKPPSLSFATAYVRAPSMRSTLISIASTTRSRAL